jgi:hypothetical protein
MQNITLKEGMDNSQSYHYRWNHLRYQPDNPTHSIIGNLFDSYHTELLLQIKKQSINILTLNLTLF